MAAVAAGVLIALAAGAAESYVGLKKLAVPFYAPGEPEAEAVLRIDRVFREYERRGFFRIGLLPVIVGEGVTLEFRDRAAAARSMDRVRQGLESSLGGGRIELRQLVVTCRGAEPRSLKAGRVRVEKPGRWRMSDGVAVETGRASLRASNALMQASGPQAGRLVLSDPGRVEADLFGPAQ